MNRLPSPALMSDARSTYVPAMAWLRANGWTWRNGRFISQSKRLAIAVAAGATVSDTPWINVTSRTAYGSLVGNVLMADVTSCQQAVDFLVTFGILPGPLHSLMRVDAATAAYEAPLPEVYGEPRPALIDADGDPWYRCTECPGYHIAGAGPDSTCRDRDWIERGYGPVSEVAR